MKAGLIKFAVLAQISLFPLGNSLSVSTERPTKPALQKTNNTQATTNNTLAPPCKEIDWATWTSFTGKSATGMIYNQGREVNVTVSSNFEFASTPQMERYDSFKRFQSPIPNTTIPRTSWSKEPGGTTTICFSQSVKEPVLLLASLGSYKGRILVTINFSEPYVMMLNVGGMIAESNTALTGREGYAIVKFPGDVRCITIQSSAYENFTDFTLGIPVCPEGIPKPAVKQNPPKPEPKPVEVPKPAPAVIAAPKPEPKLVEVPKPAPAVVAAPKPEPKPVEVPKPAPAVVAAPKPEPKPVEVPKPAPVVIAAPKPEPKPVEVPKPAPVVIAAPKPDPKPVEIPKPAPAVVAAPKPEPKPVEVPKPAPAVVAAPKPEPKPVEVPKPVVPAVVTAPKPIIKPLVPTVIASKKDIIRLKVWDYDGMDRDSISLKLNGKPVGPSAIQLPLYKLYGSDESIYSLNLQSGENKLEVFVISEGLKPLATIALLLMYEDGPKRLFFELKAKETVVIDL